VRRVTRYQRQIVLDGDRGDEWICSADLPSLSFQLGRYLSAHFRRPCVEWKRVGLTQAARQLSATIVPIEAQQAAYRFSYRDHRHGVASVNSIIGRCTSMERTIDCTHDF
jgi:hypothetical protein